MAQRALLRMMSTVETRAAVDRLATAAFASIAAGLLVLYTYRNAPAVPIWDGWLWIAQARTYLDSGVARVVETYGLNNNEHLYVLPSALFLFASPGVDFSSRPFALAGAVLLVALGVLFYAIARSAGLKRFEALLVLLVAVSFRHYENLLIGFQFGLVLSVVTGASAVYLADREASRAGLPLCLILAFLSAASSAVGLIALGLVPAVRSHGEWNRKRVMFAVIAFSLLVLAGAGALYSLEVMRGNYFDKIARAFEGKSVARVLVDWIRIMGGGLVADQAAPAVGLAIVAWLAVCLTRDLHSKRRLSGLSGLALFSLLSTLAVAWGRSPIPSVASRWAVFAAPGIAAGLIWLLLRLTQRDDQRTNARVASTVVVCFLFATNFVDAASYAQGIYAWEMEVRTYLAYLKVGGALSNAEIGRVNPGAPEFIRALMEFYNEKSPQRDRDALGLEVRRSFPSTIAREATMRHDGNLLLLSGPGYVFDRWTCQHPSGCAFRLAVELSAAGAATIGIIVRRPDGSERININHPVPRTSGFDNETVIASAAFGELVDPYVFCFTNADTVRIRDFTVFSVRAAGPGR